MVSDLSQIPKNPELPLLEVLQGEIEYISTCCEDPKEPRLLLAVSGGGDSMALLGGCLLLARTRPLQLGVAHIDHGVRPQSGSDANFVGNYAAEAGLPCFVRDGPSLPLKVNKEAWLRQERYRLLHDIRRASEYDLVVTAHTAGDVVETFLMRLLANKEPGAIARLDTARRVFRPLLGLWREDLEGFREAFGIPHIEDETNLDPRYTRNAVRHKLIPFLQREFGQQVPRLLLERASAAATDRQLATDLLDSGLKWCNSLALGSKGWRKRVEETLHQLPSSSHWLFLELLLRPVLKYNLGRKHGARAAEFFMEGRREVELPGGVVVRRLRGGIEFILQNRLQDDSC